MRRPRAYRQNKPRNQPPSPEEPSPYCACAGGKGHQASCSGISACQEPEPAQAPVLPWSVLSMRITTARIDGESTVIPLLRQGAGRGFAAHAPRKPSGGGGGGEERDVLRMRLKRTGRSRCASVASDYLVGGEQRGRIWDCGRDWRRVLCLLPKWKLLTSLLPQRRR